MNDQQIVDMDQRKLAIHFAEHTTICNQLVSVQIFS